MRPHTAVAMGLGAIGTIGAMGLAGWAWMGEQPAPAAAGAVTMAQARPQAPLDLSAAPAAPLLASAAATSRLGLPERGAAAPVPNLYPAWVTQRAAQAMVGERLARLQVRLAPPECEGQRCALALNIPITVPDAAKKDPRVVVELMDALRSALPGQNVALSEMRHQPEGMALRFEVAEPDPSQARLYTPAEIAAIRAETLAQYRKDRGED